MPGAGRSRIVRARHAGARDSFARRGQLSLTGVAGGRSRTKVNLQRAPRALRPQVSCTAPARPKGRRRSLPRRCNQRPAPLTLTLTFTGSTAL